MYDFDAYEAVDDLIDEINDEYAAEAVDAYQQIYDELCERVECDELTLEEAELINDVAAEKYLFEKKSTKETDDEDDDKPKKKKKINKKKVAAGVAAGALAAGTLAYAKKRKKDDIDFKRYKMFSKASAPKGARIDIALKREALRDKASRRTTKRIDDYEKGRIDDYLDAHSLAKD